MVELLAPAGSREALIAAVESGANAVYMAGNQFGARAYANNFDEDGLKEAIRFAHLRDVLINITVNTIVDDEEIPALKEYLLFLREAGADAILVQDLGVARIAREIVPDMPLHASTQMTVHSLEGVLALQELGFTRVVLSRELSLKEIAHICANCDVEIEVFMHGALCVCYSGQCLMSSMIGGRSGNRGRCAQPCRLPYTLVDENGQDVLGDKAGSYLLSPRDLNTIDVIPDLRDFDAYISFVNNKFQSVYHCLIRMAHEGIKGLNSKSEKFPMGTNADNSSQPSDTPSDEDFCEKEAIFEGQSGSEENQNPSDNKEAGTKKANPDNKGTFEEQISKIASDTLDKTTALNNRAFKAIAKLKEQSEGEGKEKDSSAGKLGKSGTSDKAGDSGKDKQPENNDSKPNSNPQQKEPRLKKKEEKDQALIKKGESTVLELLHSGLPGLDEQSALNDIFAGNNRSSKDNHHSDHKEYGYLEKYGVHTVTHGKMQMKFMRATTVIPLYILRLPEQNFYQDLSPNTNAKNVVT